MNKKIHFLILLLLLFTCISTISTSASIKYNFETLPCSCDDSTHHNNIKTTNKEIGKNRPGFWTEENLKFLSETERQQLSTLQNKIINGEKLSLEEKQQIWALKDIVVKAKLGDEKFTDFKNLMTKKKNGEKLSNEELVKIKLYFNEIKGD